MSSRALRKLQAQQEIEKLAAQAEAAQQEEESDEEEETTTPAPKNAFDMLNEVEESEEEEQEDDKEDTASKPVQDTPAPTSASKSTPSKSSKKKKKQKKKATASKTTTPPATDDDEIEKALRELAVNNDEGPAAEISAEMNWLAQATTKLVADEKYKNPVNEMRGLFGKIALEDDSRRNARTQAPADGHVDLATALTGKYCPASRGKELGTLAKRKNCFVQGRPEWPLVGSGGLIMEALPHDTFERKYNYIHNESYKDQQHDYLEAVSTMQPEAMIRNLQTYPYHVATLLTVAEIAKQQGDASVASDLLERVLFTFGRSVNSSFSDSLRSGTARLPFKSEQNRELYMGIWRYIRSLEQRGTWRTAFEWSKELLQLDVLGDPFGITLCIDQLAVRGRREQEFLDMVEPENFGDTWAHLPNIRLTKVIALLRIGKPKEARQQLATCMHQYPYILAALASTLEVQPVPKNIWGKLPGSDAEKLYTELYVTRAKDLWNTPETIGLITEVANTLSYYKVNDTPAPPKLEISLEEARHIMLLEDRALIALLPRKYTQMRVSPIDVLPPPDSNAYRAHTDNASQPFTARAPTAQPNTAPNQALEALRSIAQRASQAGTQIPRTIQDALGWFLQTHTEGTGPGNVPMTEAEQEVLNEYAAAALGLDDEELAGAFGGMPGAFETDQPPSDDEMPSLGDEPVQPSRGPHATTIEDAEDEDESNYTRTNGLTTGILEDATATASSNLNPNSNVRTEPPRGQSSTATTIPSSTSTSTETPVLTAEEIESNPQRLQRWLLGAGIEELTAEGSKIGVYVRRLRMLNRNQQGWTLNMVRQRGGSAKDTVEKIERAL